MFLNIFVLYFTLQYSSYTYASKCEEYIIIIPEHPICDPIQVESIDWPNLDCPYNSTDVLTYKEFKANKKCVLELYYIYGVGSCKSKRKQLTNTQHSFIPIETTTTIKDSYNINDKKRIETKESNTNSTHVECETGVNSVACRNNKSKTANYDTINPVNEINLIFHNETAIEFNREIFDYNDWITSKVALYCEFTQDICIDENKVAFNNYLNSTINTILATIVKVNINKPSLKYNIQNKNFTNINCTSPNTTYLLEQQKYIAAIYDVIKIFYCINKTFDAKISILNSQTNYKVNSYFPPELISNTKKVNNIECAHTFIFVNKQTVRVECEAVELSETHSNNINNYTEVNTASLNHTYSIIWDCDYTNSENAIICDQLQSQKYKSLQFFNCTEDNDSQNKRLSDNKGIINYNYRLNLKNKDFHLKTNKTRQKNDGINLFNKNVQLQFVSNKTNCDESLTTFHIATGNIFNFWANDNEEIINKHYNFLFIELNLLNCIIYNSTSAVDNNETLKFLKLGIILGKQNTTNLNFLIEKYLNENEKDRVMNIAVINCSHPNLTALVNISNVKHKLKLICEFEDLEKYKNNITSKTSENYGASTEPYKLGYTRLIGSTTGVQNEEKWQHKEYFTNTTDITTKTSNIIDDVKLVVSTITESTATKIPARKRNEENNTLNPTEYITESTYKQNQSGLTNMKRKTKEDASYISPLIYILAIVASICFISIVTIIGLKIWKPTYKYRPVALRPRNNAEESSL